MVSDSSVDSRRIVYTPSPFARSSLLYLQEAGTLSAVKSHKSARTSLASYLFFVVLDGEGSLNYNGQHYPLTSGDCVFIDCLRSYAHSTDHPLWTLQWAHFDGANMDKIYAKYTERGGQPVFHPESVSGYTELLDALILIGSSDDYLRDMRINEQLAALLTKIMEKSWLPNHQAERRRGMTHEFSLQDIKEYLDQNWMKKIALDELADHFFINKYYLTRLFRSRYGSTITSYLQDLRITQAKKLLRFTDETVAQISHACGYEDANYFSRAFRKVEDVSPNEYRRMWRK